MVQRKSIEGKHREMALQFLYAFVVYHQTGFIILDESAIKVTLLNIEPFDEFLDTGACLYQV